MIVDLLELSCLESVNVDFQPTTIQLGKTLDDLGDRFAETISAKKIHRHVDEESAGRSMVGSPHLLRLILENLMHNAVKFTAPGGRVSVSVAEKQNNVCITVKDNGCGIPPDEQERVVERSYQVDSARTGPDRGTGLGLAIVRHAVGAMHGTVGLNSAADQGTRGTVCIPLSASRAVAAPVVPGHHVASR